MTKGWLQGTISFLINGMKAVKKIFFISFIIFSFIGFTYTSYKISFIGSLFIIVFSWWCWPGNFREYLGIKFDRMTFFIFPALLILVIASSYFIIKSISLSGNIRFVNAIPCGFSLLQTIGQTFNEELICGGLLLLSLKRSFHKKYLLIISILIALLFSVLHLLFYQVCAEPNRGILTFLTLCNLFLFRLITNTLIIYTDHIFYAWAIHFGWNIIFLGNFIQANLNEPALFNTFIGTIHLTFYLIILLAAASLLVYYIRKGQQT
ncbi:MAG: hypothetical protein JXB88_00280 [Spirochaetales bacterium]|nr:hypothetical protein [Spirochaetales bacterium]